MVTSRETRPLVSDVHHLTVARSGRWWAIRADNLPGCHTQAKRRSKIEATAREAVALWFDASEADVGPLVVTFAERG